MSNEYIDGFNFKKCPELLKVAKKYFALDAKALKLSVKDSSKYGKSSDALREYEKEVFAKAIFETFKIVKPKLHNRMKGGDFEWDEVFADSYEKLDWKQIRCLSGLISRNFVYELPDEYYNN